MPPEGYYERRNEREKKRMYEIIDEFLKRESERTKTKTSSQEVECLGLKFTINLN
jgi:hypothetical protein